MSKISIIIRTFNEEDYIGKTLEQVFAQTFKDFEVIIIDSGSTDKTLSIISGFFAKVITISSKDFSYGGALNTGIKASEGEISVFLSAHAVPCNNKWLEKLTSPLSDGSKLAGVYGRQQPHPKCNAFDAYNILKAYPDKYDRKQGEYFYSNVNSAAKKEILVKYPFNESLPYAEDQVWSKEIIKKGYLILYSPEASVFHSHDEGFLKTLNRRKREFIVTSSLIGYPPKIKRHLLLKWILRDYLIYSRVFLKSRRKLKDFIMLLWYPVAMNLGKYLGINSKSIL